MSGRSQAVMKAIRVAAFGGPEVLKVDTNVPVPAPTQSQVLVEVKAAGINPVDTYIRSGTYALKPPLPYTPGSDAAGIIKEVGSAVTKFKPGDRVYVARRVYLSGGYSGFTTADDTLVHPLSAQLSFQQGAGIGIPCYTAFLAFGIKGREKAVAGNSVLIHGASGAVGLACVQMAAARGMKVLGTAGTQEGLDLVIKNGATAVFNHREEGYTDKIQAATNGEGPDLIIEMLANVNLQTDLSIVKRNGIIVVVGNRGNIEINPRLMMQRESKVTGLVLMNAAEVVGNRGNIEINPRLMMQRESKVTGLVLMNAAEGEWSEMHQGIAEGIQAGWLQPHIHKEYTLEQAPQAHDDVINSPATLGKRVFVL